MTTKPWRLFKRNPRWRRRMAERGKQFDGSTWLLHGRYETLEAAEAVKALIIERDGPQHQQLKILHQDAGRP